MDPEALAAHLQDLLKQVSRLQLQAAQVAHHLELASYGEENGSTSTVDWIRHTCKVSRQVALDLTAVGFTMGLFPQTTAALRAGEVGFGHLAHMAHSQRQLLGGQRLDEDHLLEEARQVSVSRFWYVCQQARHAADPEGFAKELERQRHARSLHLRRRTDDGMFTLGGLFDPVSGATIKAALEPLAEKAGKADQRSREERLADALVELARMKSRVRVTVTATMGTLLQVPNSAPGDFDGTLVPQATIQRMTCDCSIARMVFSPESIVLDAGRAKRVVPPSTRRALEARDRHCRWPGCEKPGTWSEAHHIIHWSRGGATNLDNLILFCGYHHTLLHEGRWKLVMHPDGKFDVVRPPLDFLAPPRAPALAA